MYRNWQQQDYFSNREQSSVQQNLSVKLKDVCQKLKIITDAFLKLKLQVKDRDREIQRLKKQNAAMKDISTFRNPRETVGTTNISSFYPENRFEYSSRDFYQHKSIKNPLEKELKTIQYQAHRFSENHHTSPSKMKLFEVQSPIKKIQGILVPKIKINATETYRRYDTIPFQNIALSNEQKQFGQANIRVDSKKFLIENQQNQEQRVKSEDSQSNQKKVKQINSKDQQLLNKIWKQRDREIQRMQEIWRSINQKLQKKEVSSILADETND